VAEGTHTPKQLYVVSSAVRTAVSDDTSVPLSHWGMTLTTQEAGHMPVEVWGHVEPIVIIYVLLASMTHLGANVHWSIRRLLAVGVLVLHRGTEPDTSERS
jgi:hypothetical protein